LPDTLFNFRLIPGAIHDGGVLFGRNHFARGNCAILALSRLQSQLFSNRFTTTCKRSNVGEHFFSEFAKAWGF